MMKALLVAHTAAPSGAELATFRLAAALRGGAYSGISLAAVFTEDGPMVSRMRERGIETTVLHGKFDSRAMTIATSSPARLVGGFIGLAKLGWSLGALATESEASVIVAESTKSLVMGAVAARRADIPLVWHVHDRISAEYFGPLLCPLIRLLGWLVSDGYIANSKSTLSSLITWRKRTIVAYPGIERRTQLARAPQRSPEKTIVVFVGRLTRWKGPDLFLRALRNVKVLPDQVYLVGGTFFGEEAFQHELELLAENLGLTVTFTGHVDHPEEFMRRADILVHCSVIAEPFGQVVVEGMHAGCAVIASRPGGPAEIVQPGVNGILVDGGDELQLTRALDYLIADRALRQRLATFAQARARDFDIAETARAVALFLDGMVGRRTRIQARSG